MLKKDLINRFFLLVVTLLLCSSCSLLNPDIKEITSIQEVSIVFEQATKNDLFVFDVDEVILEPSDPAVQQRFSSNTELEKMKRSFVVDFIEKKGGKDKELFHSKVLLKKKYQPVEKTLIDAILALQKRNIKVIALTAMPYGRYGLIERMEAWRHQGLLSLGLDFSASFKQHELHFDEELKKEYPSLYQTGKVLRPAGFYEGIACSGRFPKGIVLRVLLAKIGWKPARVFFFDDQRNNVESVLEEMKKMGIPCKAFVYKAASVARPMTADIEVIRFQLELMKQRDDYVSYDEAKELWAQQKGFNINDKGQKWVPQFMSKI